MIDRYVNRLTTERRFFCDTSTVIVRGKILVKKSELQCGPKKGILAGAERSNLNALIPK